MPRRNLNTDDAAGRKYRRRRCDKLLSAVQESRGSPETSKAFVDYLTAEYSFYFLEELLQPLDASLVPEGPLPQHRVGSPESVEWKNANDALQALQKLGPFFKALTHAQGDSPSEDTTACIATCLETLANSWFGVSKWMAYSLLHASRMPDHGWLVTACTNILVCLTSDYHGTPSAINREMGTKSSTIDIIFILLGQKDKEGRYYTASHRKYSEGCTLMSLLSAQFDDNMGREALDTRYDSVSRTTRRAMVASLVDRAAHLVKDIGVDGKLVYAAVSVQHLFDGALDLAMYLPIWKEFIRQDGIAKFTSALCTLSDTAHVHWGGFLNIEFWMAMSWATEKLICSVIYRSANPAENLAQMFECGVFLCMVRSLWCSLRPETEFGCSLPPRALLPYLRMRKVFEVLYRRGDIDAFRQRDKDLLNADIEKMCEVFQGTLDDSTRVFIDRKDASISMCSNLNHKTSSIGADEADPEARHVKTCCCRAVVYCSIACQAEDWHALHSKECRPLRVQQVQRGGILKSTKNIVRLQRDHLAYMEYVLNHRPPMIPILNSLRRWRGRHWDDAAPLLTVDLAVPATTIPYVEEPDPHPELGPLMQKYDITAGTDREWEARIHRCITDESREGERTFLVEATFPLEGVTLIFIFAKMRYVPDAPLTERFKVVSSVFRLGWKPELYDLPPGFPAPRESAFETYE
ncbi:hypothetical protein D9611_011875 [Ephemerocybe angulata]|uniref:MYND-type domain-containing protein n=1 Tax=Ephemerocybe angulata TaxID=980116 RepID=A0A8H5BY54_9AGAR|nr:hypothetical protein D9611_011875 [Tulosesus angulatus]